MLLNFCNIPELQQKNPELRQYSRFLVTICCNFKFLNSRANKNVFFLQSRILVTFQNFTNTPEVCFFDSTGLPYIFANTFNLLYLSVSNVCCHFWKMLLRILRKLKLVCVLVFYIIDSL